MKQTLSIVLLISLFMFSCQKENKDFIIAKKQVGKITDSTKIKELKTIFGQDSIAKNTEGQGAFEAYDEYTVYDKKTHKPLLVIIPQKTGDDESLVKQVEILDGKFKSDKGISFNSKFGEIKKAHKIGKVDESFKYLVIYLDDLNATIDIKKNVLPLDAQNNPGLKIDETMIPDDAKIKHFIVFFND